MQFHNRKREVTTWAMAAVLCLFAARPAVAQRASDSRHDGSAGVITLETKLPNFSAAGMSRLHALIELGQQLRLPLGVECVEPSAFQPLPAVTLSGASVREVVESILGAKRGYVLRLAGGVLNVNCAKGAGARGNLFRTVVPHFSVPRTNLATASLNLRMALMLRLHSEGGGFVGDYAPAPLGHDVGPLQMRGATVRQILNEIVRSYGKAAWVATAPPSRLGRLPQSGLWTIVDYMDPKWADSIRALRAQSGM